MLFILTITYCSNMNLLSDLNPLPGISEAYSHYLLKTEPWHNICARDE
jgi:hypothetical protein